MATTTNNLLLRQAATTDVVNVVADLDIPYARIDAASPVSAKAYGALGDGTTDDTAAIQAALAATGPGGVCLLPPGRYLISAPLILPPAVTLLGTQANHLTDPTFTQAQSTLVGKSTFSGVAMIRMLDKEVGGYALDNGGQRIRYLNLDGSAIVTGTVDGIRAQGQIRDVVLSDLYLDFVRGTGVSCLPYTRIDTSVQNPSFWTISNVVVKDTQTGEGFHLDSTFDSFLVNCLAEGVFSNGFYITGVDNTTLVGCHAEWSEGYGFYITGSWPNANGSGGLQMSGCSTDRNSKHGVFVDASGGTGPLLFSGLMMRRDGRNGNPGTGGGNWAGFAATSSTHPIVISGVTCFPGVNDNNTGVNSPQIGLSFTGNTFVSVAGGYIHAATTPVNDGGGNTNLILATDLGVATGTTSAPVRSYLRNNTETMARATATTAVGTTVTDIAGLSLPVPGAGTYRIYAWIPVVCSATTALTTTVSRTGAPTTSALQYSIKRTQNNTATGVDLYSAFNTATQATAAPALPNLIEVEGTMVATNSGTYAIAMTRTGTSATTQIGSYVRLDRIA